MNDDLHHLTGVYVVDALDDGERAAFESHLATCADCREEVRTLRETAARLAAVADQPPPAHLRAEVLARVRAVRPLPPLEQPEPAAAPPAPVVGRRGPVGRWLLAAAAAVVLVGGGLAWHPWSPDPVPLTTAEQVLAAPGAQRWSVPMGTGSATVVRSADGGRAAVLMEGLHSPPSGMAYETWLQMPDGSMHPAGMVPAGAGARAAMLLEGDVARAVGFGLTLEPAAGSQAPTATPLVLLPLT